MRIGKFLDGRFILLMVFLNAPVILSEIFAQELTLRVLRHAASYALYAIFIAAVISAAGSQWLKRAILIFCAAIFLADIFALFYYETPVNRTMLGIILATNSNEASEFISAYVLRGKFLAVAALTAAIFVALCKAKLPRVNEKFLAGILIVAAIISVMRLAKKPVEVFEKGNSASRLAVMLPEVVENLREYESLASVSSQQVQITRNDSELPLVIFILGESTTRNHMSLYGYALPTTPRLDERNSRGELKIFSDTVSPHSHTMAVLRELFSFYRRENEGDSLSFWLGRGNFFSIMNAAGYDTIWLSNQEASGIFGNVGKFYSETCTRRKFTQLRDSMEENSANFDGAILPLFDEDLSTRRAKSFYVLHLMGTHSIYNRRYPAAFDKFAPADGTAAASARAEYDNAVRYNDYIVDQIITRAENLDAVVIYISDHGEDVYDDKDFTGHEESSPSRFMIEIPFVVWTSPKFRENHADVENRLNEARDKPFMTDDMIHLLLDMLAVETVDFDAQLSPLNSNYNSGRQRIYGGMVYDRERGLH